MELTSFNDQKPEKVGQYLLLIKIRTKTWKYSELTSTKRVQILDEDICYKYFTDRWNGEKWEEGNNYPEEFEDCRELISWLFLPEPKLPSPTLPDNISE